MNDLVDSVNIGVEDSAYFYATVIIDANDSTDYDEFKWKFDFNDGSTPVEVDNSSSGDADPTDPNMYGFNMSSSHVYSGSGEYDPSVTVTLDSDPNNPMNDTAEVTVVKVASLEPVGSPTSFLEDPDDPNTVSYSVCVDANDGTLTVNAVPDPNVDESDLPDSWELEGGTGTGKLTRDVDISEAGLQTVTASCGMSSKTVKIYVVEVQGITRDGGSWFEDGDSDPNTNSYVIEMDPNSMDDPNVFEEAKLL